MQDVMDFREFVVKYINKYKDDSYHFKTFSEYVNENPVAEYEDCQFGQETLMKLQGVDDYIDYYSHSYIRNFDAIYNKGGKNLKNYVILTNNISRTMLGVCDDGLFKIYSYMNFKVVKNKKFGEVKEVKAIDTHTSHRGKRMATAIYKSMMFDGDIIMSDSVQHINAIKLWKNFINSNQEWKYMIDDKRISVVLYDNITSTIISDDLTRMKDDEIWSITPKTDKSEYRLIAYIK